MIEGQVRRSSEASHKAFSEKFFLVLQSSSQHRLKHELYLAPSRLGLSDTPSTAV